MKRATLQVAALILLAATAACHHAQPIIAVTEERFRLENKTVHPDQPPNPAYSPLPLPLSPADSDRVVQFLAAGDSANAAANTSSNTGGARDYTPLLKMLRDKPWKYEEVLDQGAFKPWFPEMQVGGVVDARDPKPPSFPPLAGHSGHFWWVFHVHGHDITGLTIFKEAVPPPEPRSKH